MCVGRNRDQAVELPILVDIASCLWFDARLIFHAPQVTQRLWEIMPCQIERAVGIPHNKQRPLPSCVPGGKWWLDLSSEIQIRNSRGLVRRLLSGLYNRHFHAKRG